MSRCCVIVPDKQTSGRESPHNWLVREDMNLVTFYDIDVEIKRT